MEMFRNETRLTLTDADASTLDKIGAEITEIKQNNQYMELYIQGLVSMAMRDLDYTDTDIDHVVNEVIDNYRKDAPADVIAYAIAHDYTR